LAPRLSFLRRLPILAALADEPAAVQFNLQTLFVAVGFVGFSLGCFRWFGFAWLAGFAFVSGIVGLAVLLHRGFVNAIVIGLVTFLFATLTINSLEHARNEARQMTVMDNMRKIQDAFQSASDFKSLNPRANSIEARPEVDIEREGNRRD
jgi:hypothetical protein